MREKQTKIIIDGDVIVMPHFSGIGHYTLEMLRAIDRQLDKDSSFRVSILIHFRHMDKAKKYGFKNIKIIRSSFSLRISNGLKTRNIQPPLDAIFGKAIYIFPNYTSWPLIWSKGVSFIYDISYEKYPEFAEPRNQRFLSNQVVKSIKRSSMIATISENSKKEICEFYKIKDDKVKIFYPSVDQKLYYHRTPKEISEVKLKYGIKDEYILFIGNLEPRKNLKNLLLAYEQLPTKLQEENSLLFIGSKGWQNDEIIKIIKRLRKQGRSILIPDKHIPDEEIPAFYSGAKIFVYPSIYEGFGIPPIESMACGTPVISANNSSLPEAVGDSALMVDALSVTDISSNMARLLNDHILQKKLIEKGYEQVNKFSWDESAKNFLISLKNL